MTDAVVYSERGVETYDDLDAARAAAGTTWVHTTDPDAAALQSVADVFDVHPLVVEDVVNDVRSKTEEFSEYTFCLVKVVELTPGETEFDEEVEEIPVGVVLGSDWVLTLSTTAVDQIDRVRAAVERCDERLLQHGADFTAYRIIDVVVDGYFRALDQMETAIEGIEEAVLVSTDIDTLEAINEVRRDLLAFRKVAWSMREALGTLARGDPVQVRQATEKYFRDAYDHLVQVVDLTETYRDLTASARDIYLNTLSQSTNEVMKRLTVIAVIFLPLTFVAGVFGMNFETMPELTWPLGYYATLLGMTCIAVVLLGYFRQQNYL